MHLRDLRWSQGMSVNQCQSFPCHQFTFCPQDLWVTSPFCNLCQNISKPTSNFHNDTYSHIKLFIITTLYKYNSFKSLTVLEVKQCLEVGCDTHSLPTIYYRKRSSSPSLETSLLLLLRLQMLGYLQDTYLSAPFKGVNYSMLDKI